jgi:hypothetical protein
MGDPANTEHDIPLELAVEQSVLGEPGPTRVSLNTRLGCDAKVRNWLASAAEGGVNVRSLLLTYIPSPVASGPPRNDKVVFVVTSELQPLPSVVVHVPEGRAAGSLLKIRLCSDTVTVPVDPVSKVLMTLAEAFELKSKPPDRTATGAKASRNLRSDVLENRFIRSCPSEDLR